MTVPRAGRMRFETPAAPLAGIAAYATLKLTFWFRLSGEFNPFPRVWADFEQQSAA